MPAPSSASTAAAIASSARSPRGAPTSCNPTGNPAAVKPAGTDNAGSVVAEIREQALITLGVVLLVIAVIINSIGLVIRRRFELSSGRGR